VQHILQGLLVVGAIVVAFVPRRKSPLQLAAFTAALLAGFELCLTYWLYTYIPWFFGFAAIAMLAPLAVVVRAPVPDEAEEGLERDPQGFDPNRPAVV
jgi:peptidoglycan/LPS O-acetylase OafA/YrhL